MKITNKSEMFSGKIEDVKVYKRALSEKQVIMEYQLFAFIEWLSRR